jgi:hypothetical protein
MLAAILLPLAFGLLCLLAFVGLKPQADAARGQGRFYVVGLYRSVALAFGVVGLMLAISRLLSAIIP